MSKKYSTYIPTLLLELWEQSKLTLEQAVGHILQRLRNHLDPRRRRRWRAQDRRPRVRVDAVAGPGQGLRFLAADLDGPAAAGSGAADPGRRGRGGHVPGLR